MTRHINSITNMSIILATAFLISLNATGSFAETTKNGKKKPPLPGAKAAISLTNPALGAASRITVRPTTQRIDRQVVRAGQGDCHQSFRRDVRIEIKGDGQNLSGAQIAIIKVVPNSAINYIVRDAATFGGRFTARKLCPGNYAVYAYGRAQGRMVKKNDLYYMPEQKTFSVARDQRVTINMPKYRTRISINRVSSAYPNHTPKPASRVRMSPRAGGNQMQTQPNGAVTATVHCCQEYTFSEVGVRGGTHFRQRNLKVKPRHGVVNNEVSWTYVPTFVMPNIVGMTVRPPFNGTPRNEFKQKWNASYHYQMDPTNNRSRHNKVKLTSRPGQQFPYGHSVIIHVWQYSADQS